MYSTLLALNFVYVGFVLPTILTLALNSAIGGPDA